MKDSDTQDTSSIPPSLGEAKLLEQLRANPVMAEKFSQIMNRFEQEVANGTDANEAELMVIEELRELGTTMLGHWAKSSHAKTITEAKEDDPSLTHHTQKNSNGIPPSESSA